MPKQPHKSPTEPIVLGGLPIQDSTESNEARSERRESSCDDSIASRRPVQSVGSNHQDRDSAALVFLSLVGLGLGYATSIIVARTLGPTGFERYAVAIAALAMLSTTAESGVGKLALQILPMYETSKHWALAAGYWRFSLRVVALVSCGLAVAVVVWDVTEDNQLEHHAMLIAALFLPAAALAGASIDFVMANQTPIRGATIARVVIPSTTLLLILTARTVTKEFSPSWAVACYGGGAVVGAGLAMTLFRRTVPPQIFSASPNYETKYWFRECLTFLALTTLVSWMFRISLITLEAMSVPAMEVASFAAAFETGCLVLLLSKSTDKFFQPYISVMIERESWIEGVAIRKRRLLWMGVVCVIFLLVIFLFGKQILGLYGDAFVGGYPALCLVATASSVWTLFSLAPAYLKFSGLNRLVLGIKTSALVAMVGLTIPLGGRWGAMGAGLAFCVVMTSTSLVFLFFARRQFRRVSHLPYISS